MKEVCKLVIIILLILATTVITTRGVIAWADKARAEQRLINLKNCEKGRHHYPYSTSVRCGVCKVKE